MLNYARPLPNNVMINFQSPHSHHGIINVSFYISQIRHNPKSHSSVKMSTQKRTLPWYTIINVSGTGRSEYQRRTRLYGFSRHLILSPKDNPVARGGNAIIRASHSSAPVPRRACFNSHSREATTYPFS